MLKSRLSAIIANPYPGTFLMTSIPRATASTAAFVAGDRVAVLVFLAPKFYFFLLGTFDASLAHLLVVLDLCLRKLAVLSEDDVEAQAEYA